MGLLQFKIAEAYEAQSKLAEATEEYLKVTYLYNEDPKLTIKALLRVAAIYENKENYPEALKIYRRIIALSPEEAKYAQERLDWIQANIKH
jgi:tetratricopeptide (TPR) repeat protein